MTQSCMPGMFRDGSCGLTRANSSRNTLSSGKHWKPSGTLQRIIMLPPCKSTYLQYKEDTDVVRSWLATTALDCGYSGNLLNEESDKQQQPRSQRLKGKARKETKETTLPTESQKPPHRIPSTRAYPILAKYIADSKPSVQIPNFFTETLNNCILLRKQFSASLKDPAYLRNDRKNKSHSYFVTILEEVRSILEIQGPSEAPKGSAINLTNLFTTLNVDEPSQAFLDAPDARPTSKPEFKAPIHEDPFEAYLALNLLIDDFNTIRRAVDDIWNGYKEGKHTLIAAALTTNTAIDFARELEQDFSDVIERNGGFEEMYSVWWSLVCDECGIDPDHREIRMGGAFDLLTYETADAVMWLAYILLKQFISGLKPNVIPVTKRGHWGPIDLSGDWDAKRPQEKFQFDLALIFETFGSLVALIRLAQDKGLDSLAVEDELIRGLRIATETRKVSLWNVLSVQIMLDIHHRLRKDVLRPYESLQAVGSHVGESINNYLKFFRPLQDSRWPQWQDEEFLAIQQQNEELITVDIYREEMLLNFGRAPEKHFHFTHHPVFAGLFAYHIQMRFHDAAVSCVNSRGIVLAARHLYNAMKHEKLITATWPDMELLALIQPDATAFAGDAPKRRQDYFKRLAIMNGMSTVSFSNNARHPRLLQQSASGARPGIKQKAELAHVFAHRYLEGSRRVELSLDEMEKIMDNTNAFEDQTTQPGSSRQRGRARRLTIPEHLHNMCAALTRETNSPDFLFDYLAMQSECRSLLDLVTSDDRMRTAFGIGSKAKQNDFPEVVGGMLAALAETKNPGVPDYFEKGAERWQMLFSRPDQKTCSRVKTFLWEQYQLKPLEDGLDLNAVTGPDSLPKDQADGGRSSP
ncbi:hypothetical protein IWZ00DRAFT_569551 [Phyllosticta capitalensis]